MSDRVLRTPDDRFRDVPDFPYSPQWITVRSDDDFAPVRMAWVDDGGHDVPPVLCLHGEPSWSFLYRHMMPIFKDGGFHAIAPDLIGFGRSDKPTQTSDYSYARHTAWLRSFIENLDLKKIHLVCQDWGGLLGLRLVAEMPERFAAVVASNTFLPTGHGTMPEAFLRWREFSQTVPEFPVGTVLDMGTASELSDEVKAAYDAPFPDEAHKAGARVFPTLVPIDPEHEASKRNQRAWEALAECEIPFLCAFGDSDPVTGGLDKFLIERIPGAHGQPHTTIENAGHFIQEDQPVAFANTALEFFQSL